MYPENPVSLDFNTVEDLTVFGQTSPSNMLLEPMLLVTNNPLISFRHSHVAVQGYCNTPSNVRVMLGVQLTILYFCLLPLKSGAQDVLRQKGKNTLLKY